ncbi:MAG: hypothetical protein GXO62_00905 [Epsilonproteobacteria bacterium]|nr:hypothetical protein [Campylobacterota bacterium]
MLEIIETKKFKKLLRVLIKYSVISQGDYENAKELFKKERFNYKLRPHKIKCGKDYLVSLTIPNTQFRILCYLTCSPEIAIFGWIGSHKDYETIIKNVKNCKNYVFECKEIKELM